MGIVTTDFHAHLLPMCDHGSSGVDVSLNQLNMLSGIGVSRVVATPHFYPNADCVEHFLVRRAKSASLLLQSFGNTSPEIALGAEILVTPGIDAMPGLDKLTVGGTNVLLLEMPMMPWNDPLLDAVFSISRLGFSVVMAHIDRYIPSQAELLFGIGLKAQLNVSAFAIHHNKNRLLRYVADGHIVAIGSDIHGDDKRYCRDYLKACEILGGYVGEISEQTDALLSGAEFINKKPMKGEQS